MNKNKEYLVFCARLISFTMMSSSSTHFGANDRISLVIFSGSEQYYVVCIYDIPSSTQPLMNAG